MSEHVDFALVPIAVLVVECYRREVLTLVCDEVARQLASRFGSKLIRAASASDLLRRASPKTLAFVDNSTIDQLGDAIPDAPVIAICAGNLPSAVSTLSKYPWLMHVVSTSSLTQTYFPFDQDRIEESVGASKLRLLDWVPTEVAGRRVRLTHASRRVERLERMSEWFVAQGIGARGVELLRDIAEELITNAFYDAPVAAGVVAQPMSRTQDVALPDADACDLAYACLSDLAIVRVRDPFGSLTRERLMAVLTRCSRADMQVEVDESMGGAGLGMWRVFSVASFVAIAITQDRSTEFLVGLNRRGSQSRPFGIHLFFRKSKKRSIIWRLFEDNTSQPSANKSITLSIK